MNPELHDCTVQCYVSFLWFWSLLFCEFHRTVNVTVCCSRSSLFLVEFYLVWFIFIIIRPSLVGLPLFLLFISKVWRQGNKVKGLRLVCDPIHFSLHCCWARAFLWLGMNLLLKACWLAWGRGQMCVRFPPTPLGTFTHTFIHTCMHVYIHIYIYIHTIIYTHL